MMTVGLGVVGRSTPSATTSGCTDATPAGPADQRARGRPGSGRLAVQDHRRPRRRRGRPTPASIAVGGGSSPGGPDHLFPMQLAQHRRHRPQRGQLRDVRRRRPADERVARQEDRRRVLGAGGVRGPDRVRRAAGAGGLGRGATARRRRCRRRADADRVGHRPGVPQLARRAGAAGHQRRAARRADRLPRGDARHRRVEGGAREHGWTDDFKTGDDFEEFLEEQDDRVSATRSRSWGCCERRRSTDAVAAASTGRSTAWPRCSALVGIYTI